MSPINHKGLHQSWKQTSIYLKVIDSIRHYTTSLFFSHYNLNYTHTSERKRRKTIRQVVEPICIPQVLNTGNLHPAGWPFLFCESTQLTRERLERFWKNEGEWTGRVEISEEEMEHTCALSAVTKAIVLGLWYASIPILTISSLLVACLGLWRLMLEELEKKKKLNQPGKMRMRYNSWQLAKHAWLYSDLLLASKREPLVSSEFSADGTL